MENKLEKLLAKLQQDPELNALQDLDADTKAILDKIIKADIDPELAMDAYLKAKENKKE